MKSIDWSPVVNIDTIITSPTSIQTTKEKNCLLLHSSLIIIGTSKTPRWTYIIDLYKRTQWQSICFSIFYSKSFWKDLDTDFTSNFQASFASPNQKGGCFVLNFVETTISNVFFQNITDRSKMQNAESRKQNAECRILEKSQF